MRNFAKAAIAMVVLVLASGCANMSATINGMTLEQKVITGGLAVMGTQAVGKTLRTPGYLEDDLVEKTMVSVGAGMLVYAGYRTWKHFKEISDE